MSEDLKQTVIITGANRGIGLELVKVFAQNNFKIIACARKPLTAKALMELANDETNDISVHKVDVGNKLSVDNFSKVISDIKVDILINNAGILDTYTSSIDDIDLVSFAEVLNINTISPIRMMRAAMPSLRLGESRKVANISSNMGSFARLSTGAHAYRASKAALNKSMQVFAEELKSEDFTIMNLHPGWVRTDMGGAGADIDSATSANGLFKIITETSSDQCDKIIAYDGSTMPY